MYGHPKHLMTEDEARAALRAFDRLAILITPDLQASHLPLFVDGERLVGHVARANPHWRASPCPALVVMAGPEGYVSPGWYPSKAETGRAVPTWNYASVHVRGTLKTFSEAARLEAVIRRLSDRHEAGRSAPWSMDDAPRDYVDRLIGAVVGVEISIASVEGKRKLSQDKPEADRAGVIDGLAASPDPRDHLLYKAMTEAD